MAWYSIAAICVLLLAPIALWFKKDHTKAQIKGIEGEKRVKDIIDTLNFPAFHDVYLPSNNGTTQIDHVARVGNSIYVIETKNYGGTIYADKESYNWTQFVGKNKNSFLNPLKQNKIHYNAVTKITGADADVRPLVVMAGKAKFKNGLPTGVIKIADLKQHLRLGFVDAGTYGTVKEPWANLEKAIKSTRIRKAKLNHLETVDKANKRKVHKKTLKPEGRIEPRFTE